MLNFVVIAWCLFFANLILVVLSGANAGGVGVEVIRSSGGVPSC